MQEIDLHWHDLRHEGACRLLADGVDIRIIQLMLGHASVQQTQRYLNVTDEELRKGPGGQLEATDAQGGRGRSEGLTKCHTSVTPTVKNWRARQDSEPLATSESESRRFPRSAWRGDPRSGSRARQDSNLRPPA